jgi:DNA-binding SARP family transcriptional activator/TolB-like protein
MTGSGLELQLLGDVAVRRDGVAQTLPASRKCRALLAYLALSPRAVTRSALCELLWDIPNDPRGELRWSLSKLRNALDDSGRKRVIADRDNVALDLGDCFVDAIAIRDALQAGIETLDQPQLRALSRRFVGEFLENVEIDRQPLFASWLVAQRRRYRAGQTAVLERLVHGAPDDSEEVFDDLDQWLQLAPLDVPAHRALFDALARHGRVRDAQRHLETTIALFEDEGLDAAPLRNAWRATRGRRTEIATPALVVSEPSPAVDSAPTPPSRRASIAVMPFADHVGQLAAPGGGLAEGLAHDVITRLAKLRAMFVIAHGSVFALRDRNVGPEEAGRMLNVDYVASGSVQRRGERLIVASELVETRSARIIWTDTFEHAAQDALIALDEIGNNIVAAIAHEIETAERNRAILRPPNSLDAWEAYHRGLWHMYRFNRKDNDLATQFLQTSVRLDPTFSRAYANLSFTHFQNAFLHRIADRATEIDRAYEAAGQSIIVDEHDPAAHWAMGRALWLRGLHDDSIVALQRSVELSPNFAPGHYALGFVNCQSGDPSEAIRSSDYSRDLSPFDPLLFAMLATRAIAHLRLGELDVAADWALKAVARPNAHTHIQAIAAHCLAAAGRLPEARAFAKRIRETNPRYVLDEFFTAFHFAPDAEALLRKGTKLLAASA